MNMDKIMTDISTINTMLVGKRRDLTALEKAKWVVDNCKHKKRTKGTACIACVFMAIAQYEHYAAVQQMEWDCGIICPECKDNPQNGYIEGSPRTKHEARGIIGRMKSCRAAQIRIAWDKTARGEKTA